jgi:hypothetical protein
VGLVALPGPAEDERELICARIGEPELDIGTPHLPQELDGVIALYRLWVLAQTFIELLEALFDQSVEKSFLVLEVHIQIAMRAAHPLRQLSHRNAFVSVPYKCFPCGVEDRPPKLVAITLAGCTNGCDLTFHNQWS